MASNGSVVGRPPAAGMSSMSAAVSTATTPGDARAAPVSMPVIRACAIGLRTNVIRRRAVQFREPQIIGVHAALREQPGVLGAHDPGAKDAHRVSSGVGRRSSPLSCVP